MLSTTVIDRLTHRLFASSILRNSIRGEVVEEIVAMALEPDWQHTGGDWAAFDLVHPSTGLRMQVKQSAARQSWHGPNWYGGAPPPPRPRFSIAHKTGRWEGDAWFTERSRNADLFVFAWHPLTDATADHREPDQWLFYIIGENALPAAKSLSLSRLETLVEPVSYADLRRKVGSYLVNLSAGILDAPPPDATDP